MANHHQMAAIAHNDRNNSANGVRNEIGPILLEDILPGGIARRGKYPNRRAAQVLTELNRQRKAPESSIS
ncbi:MAG: hypothetical protein ACTHNN_06845 [Xanthobacteraceae bacterium]